MKSKPFNKEAGFEVIEQTYREQRYPPVYVRRTYPPSFSVVFKRVIDICLSLVLLLTLLWWLIPILCLLTWLDSGLPVFFIQKRVGLNGKVFSCFKLRTMHCHPKPGQRRTSRLGQFLRDHKLDELPQVLNVLRGQMSLVGPRPHMLSDHQEFSQAIGKRYHLRHHCKPGITGLAQISGYEGRITSLKKLRGRIRFDLFYIKKWSLGLDFLIIFKTIEHVINGIRRKSAGEVHQDRNA